MDEATRKEALATLEGMNDPIRVAILTALTLKPASAADLAAELDLPIGRVRYQLGRLRKAGLAELREQRPRRGVVERVYYSRTWVLTNEQAEQLSPQEINRVNVEVLKALVKDSQVALRAGTFSARSDFVTVRIPLRLDEKGWAKAAEVQQKTLDRLLEIQAEASARIERERPTSFTAFAYLLLFEMPSGKASRKSSGSTDFNSKKRGGG